MEIVTADLVEAKLHQWVAGNISARDLHAWAESRFAVDVFDSESEAVNEVLGDLDMMDMNLITLDDVPTLILALRSPDFDSILKNHFATVNFNSRRQELRHDPMYAPFCK